MAISYRILTEGTSAVDVGTPTATYTTASVAPTANRLVIVVAGNGETAATTVPTISGGGLTWAQTTTQQQGAGNQRVTMWQAMSASPGNGTIVIDFGAATLISNCSWKVIEFYATVITSAAGAIAASVAQTDSGTTQQALLTAPGAGNATLAAIVINSSDTFTPYANCSVVGDSVAQSTPSMQLGVIFSSLGTNPVGANVVGTPNSAVIGLDINDGPEIGAGRWADIGR